jgi:hypothetical protein
MRSTRTPKDFLRVSLFIETGGFDRKACRKPSPTPRVPMSMSVLQGIFSDRQGRGIGSPGRGVGGGAGVEPGLFESREAGEQVRVVGHRAADRRAQSGLIEEPEQRVADLRHIPRCRGMVCGSKDHGVAWSMPLDGA